MPVAASSALPQWHKAHGVRQCAVLCPVRHPSPAPPFLRYLELAARWQWRLRAWAGANLQRARRENSHLLFGSALPARAAPGPRILDGASRGGVVRRLAAEDPAGWASEWRTLPARCRWTLSPLADPTALTLQRPTRSPTLPISLNGRSLGLAAARSCYEQNRKVQSPDPSPLSVHFANLTRRPHPLAYQ
jgi:hypothetical protein